MAQFTHRIPKLGTPRTRMGFACRSARCAVESGMDNSAPAHPVSSPAPRPRLTLPNILLYERLDQISGWMLLGMAIFSPWAFGTTQPWSMWVMDVSGYALGLLLGIKGFIRYRLGHQPARWSQTHGYVHNSFKFNLTTLLAGVTLVL